MTDTEEATDLATELYIELLLAKMELRANGIQFYRERGAGFLSRINAGVLRSELIEVYCNQGQHTYGPNDRCLNVHCVKLRPKDD